MIFLQDDVIILRPLDVTDADGDYPTWLNDEITCAGNGHHRIPYTRGDARAFVETTRESSDSIVLAIEKKNGNKHVGNIALQDICWYSRSAELAIIIGDVSGRNNGVGFRASQLIINHGFMELNLHSIICRTFSNNTAMIALAKKLGMQRVGSLRKSVFKDGHYLDVEIFDLLKND